jgi:hypothetical protein
MSNFLTVAARQRLAVRRHPVPTTPSSERRASKARAAVDAHFAAIDPERTLTASELSAKLSAVVREAGGELALAKQLGVSSPLINHVRNGHNDVGRKLAEALGYEMLVVYVPLRRGGDAG